jgi:hypothetical protein
MNPPLNQLQLEQNKEAFFNHCVVAEKQVQIKEQVFQQVLALLGEKGNILELKALGEQLANWIEEGGDGIYLASYWLDTFISQVSEQVVGEPNNPLHLEAMTKNHQAYITEDSIYILLFGLNGLKVPRSFSSSNSTLEGLINNPLRQMYFKFFVAHLKREVFTQSRSSIEQIQKYYEHYQVEFEKCYQLEDSF